MRRWSSRNGTKNRPESDLCPVRVVSFHMDGQLDCECPTCGAPSMGWCARCRSYEEVIDPDDEAALAERAARELDEEREVRRLRGD